MWTEGMEKAYKSHRRIYGGNHTDQIVSESIRQLAELIVSLLKYNTDEVYIETMVYDFANVSIYLEFLKKSFGTTKAFTTAVNSKTQQLQNHLDELEFKHN